VSQVRLSAMLIIQIVKYGLQRCNVRATFRENWPSVSEVEIKIDAEEHAVRGDFMISFLFLEWRIIGYKVPRSCLVCVRIFCQMLLMWGPGGTRWVRKAGSRSSPGLYLIVSSLLCSRLEYVRPTHKHSRSLCWRSFRYDVTVVLQTFLTVRREA
jgi:hypothetical protein